MKLYKNCNADFKVIDIAGNSGSDSWAIVMRGAKKEVELLFNAFVNFGAFNLVNNTPSYTWNEFETEALFYTSRKRMLKFFKGYWENTILNGNYNSPITFVPDLAAKSIADLYGNHREPRNQIKTQIREIEYETGAMRNENPDSSFKDEVVRHANSIGMAVQQSNIKDEVEEMFGQLSN